MLGEACVAHQQQDATARTPAAHGGEKSPGKTHGGPHVPIISKRLMRRAAQLASANNIVVAAIDRSVEAAKAEEPPVAAFCLVRMPGVGLG